MRNFDPLGDATGAWRNTTQRLIKRRSHLSAKSNALSANEINSIEPSWHGGR
jgi:hypothetical protein